MKAVMDGMADLLDGLVTTGSPATQMTSPATKAQIAIFKQAKIAGLLK
jgi:hypothetical protein